MYIDYIRVYEPIWNCETAVVIDEQIDIDNYIYGINSSVDICSNSNEPIVVEYNSRMDIMASEYVSIIGPFQVDVGSEFTITIQKCPN